MIFLTSNVRFDEASQNIFQTLNEWTNGQIWDNLIYIKGRQLFDEKSVADMIANNGMILQFFDIFFRENFNFSKFYFFSNNDHISISKSNVRSSFEKNKSNGTLDVQTPRRRFFVHFFCT